MPFSGGGGGQLTNHVHDNTPLQGGPLSFNGTTIGGMNSGDITFSDGAALQTLAYPGVPAGETLTAAALSTAPSWAAAPPASSTYALVATSTLGAVASEIDITFASIDCDDISELMCVFVGGMTSSSYVQMQINGITTSYYTFGTHSNNGSSINIDTRNASAWTLCSNNSGGDWLGGTSTFHLRGGTSTASPTSSSNASYSGFGADMTPNACWFLGGSQNSTVNSFDQVRVFANSGNLTAGSKLTIYRINST